MPVPSLGGCLNEQKRPILFGLVCGGGGRIRFAAAKPRRLQVSTGHLPRAAFQIRPAILFLNAKSPVLSNWTFGGGGRIRPAAAGPRPGKQSTGLFAWTGLSNPSSCCPYAQKDQSRRIGLFVVGEDGFEPSKRNAADLQSVPFGHSGTPPYLLSAWSR